MEELQLFDKPTPIEGLVISPALVGARSSLQTHRCRENDSTSRCTEERLRQLRLWTGAGTHVGLSEVHLLLRLRLRQGPVLRLGREGVRGSSLTCAEVRNRRPLRCKLSLAETGKLAVFISSVVHSLTSSLDSFFSCLYADRPQR